MGRLEILITGSGIAGLATAIALRQLESPDFKVNIQLYEKATELREIGASIALSPNGLRTLERLGVHNALDDDVGFRGPSAIPMIYRHWKTNEVVSDDRFVNVPDHRHQTARFHRGHLHQALLEHVPRENIHLSKEVRHAEADANGVTLYFEDGTSAKGDILVGADGLRSKVRVAFNPGHALHWTGRTLFRSTFDASLVEAIQDLPQDSTHWWGPKHIFFASKLGKNQYTTVGQYDPTDYPQSQDPATVSWDQVGDVSVFRDLYKDWNPVVKALAEETPYVRLFPNFAGQPLESWVFKSRVTLVGNAAHTHGGAYAAGGSLALDDAWALYLSFLHILANGEPGADLSLQNIHGALILYEKVMLPHTERLMKNVLAGIGSSPPQNDEELRHRIKNRPSGTWHTEHDVEATFVRVLGEQERLRRPESSSDSRDGVKQSRL